MPYVRTLEAQTPPRRYDRLPWTSAAFQESATRTGVYTTRQTFTLTPVDVDGEDPAMWAFTSSAATLADGWYRIAWADALGGLEYGDPAHIPGPGARPMIQEVATLLQARTRDSVGAGTGTFTADTRPTATQVELVIDQAYADVVMRVGSDIPDVLHDATRHVVAIRAASLIEASYLPDQAGDDNTVYINFRFQYAEQIEKLVHAVQLRQAFSEPVETVV